ncbi:MAG TPA: tripartite tricarboxylate transporter substrate binding protein [Rhodoplanes sp.]|nr:tripartite tricarboxylate transporter substrate binding protein [Rhodoplanes sp.]
MAPTRSEFAALIAGCLTLVSAALLVPETAAAQPYPTHPIRIIVSSAAGGPLDIVARAVAEKLAAALKQPVVAEVRSGAGGNIAADFVSKSAPDGYTLLFTLSSTLTVNPHLYKDLGFNLKSITVVNYSTQTLFVHPSVPANNVAEFVAWARKEGPVSYAHGGNGTSSHLVMEYFRLLAGFETVGVPYRGAAAMVSDFLAGQFKVAFGSTSGLLPQAAAGKLRALAVSTSRRSPLAPDVPTVAESGYPGFELTTDFILLAPGGTPDEIVALLERKVRQAIGTAEFRDRFSKQDIWIVASTSVEAASRIKAGFDLWGDVVVRTGMKGE